MQQFHGNIFQGEFDLNSFYVTEVKNITTGSILSKAQLRDLQHYVKKDPDSCMLTINDQIPILLQKEEVAALIADLEHIIENIDDKS